MRILFRWQKLSLFSFFSAIVMFIGVSISFASENNYENNVFENNMDSWLIGTWTVLQVQIEQGGQIIVFPNHGATLSILDSGSFKYDYTSESNGERVTDIDVGDQISPTRTSPVATCKMVETGESIGHIFAYKDSTVYGMQDRQMLVNFFPTHSTKPEVRCAGSDKIISNAVTPSLGMAKPSGSNEGGPYVAYYYNVDMTNEATRDLEIWTIGDDPVRIRYYLRKSDGLVN